MKTKEPKKRPGIRRLTTSQDCRRLLSRCIKQYYAGEISETTLRAITYSLDKLIRMIESGEHEKWLEKLEAQLKEVEEKNN